MKKGRRGDDWDVSSSAQIGLKCTVEKFIFFLLTSQECDGWQHSCLLAPVSRPGFASYYNVPADQNSDGIWILGLP